MNLIGIIFIILMVLVALSVGAFGGYHYRDKIASLETKAKADMKDATDKISGDLKKIGDESKVEIQKISDAIKSKL